MVEAVFNIIRDDRDSRAVANREVGRAEKAALPLYVYLAPASRLFFTPSRRARRSTVYSRPRGLVVSGPIKPNFGAYDAREQVFDAYSPLHPSPRTRARRGIKSRTRVFTPRFRTIAQSQRNAQESEGRYEDKASDHLMSGYRHRGVPNTTMRPSLRCAAFAAGIAIVFCVALLVPLVLLVSL